jgi:DNA polymerase-1
MKLFLLDAYALIYRAYYAWIRAPRVNSKGVNTSAILGFVNTLEELLKKENPTHIGVAFDPPGPTFRHEAFAAYKAKREETPEVIRQSISVIKDIVHACHIPILEVPGYEADDVIGTVAKRMPEECPVYMMTPDKDYGQLVDSHIFIYKPKYGSSECEVLDVARVKEKYGLSNPSQMIDFLGLMGDTSDNIPGCPGVGEITAKQLIAEFGSIENLLAHTDRLKGSLREKIEQNRETILFSKFLATIRTDVPVEADLESLARKPIDEPAMRKLFDELEFRRLSNRMFGKAPTETGVVKRSTGIQTSLFDEPEMEAEADVALPSSLDDLQTVPHQYAALEHATETEALVRRVRAQRSFAFDMETTDADPMLSELTGISLALQAGEAFYLSVPAGREAAREVLSPLKEVFEDGTVLKIGHNLKYGIHLLAKYGIRMDGPMFDTLIAHYLIRPESQHGRDYLAETCLHYRTLSAGEESGAKAKNRPPTSRAPLDVRINHACEGADITLRLQQMFEKTVGEEPLKRLFYTVEMPLVPVLAGMEAVGVRLDTRALKDSSMALTQHLNLIEEEIFRLAGETFNISSPKKVGEILFDRLQITGHSRKTKSGHYTTGEDVLESMKSKHPIAEKILEFRKLRKLLSSYINTLPDLIRPADGKVHTTYNQATTSTGRLSSTNPNLQNIPVRDEKGREIRRAFIPDPGCLLLSVDYSQIELRIMAHLSCDANMLEAFRRGQDIHTATAANIFSVPLEEVTREMRRKAKTANFGIIYGISVFGLAEQLHIPRAESKALIEGYFATFPDVKTYMERSIAFAREKGYVETLFGRRRYLPDIHSRNAVVRGYAERNAINAPIQGSAADIIKVAMNRIHQCFEEEKLQSRMIMQVHDELVFNVVTGELDRAKQRVVREMEQAVELRAPLVATCGIGQNWLEAH